MLVNLKPQKAPGFDDKSVCHSAPLIITANGGVALVNHVSGRQQAVGACVCVCACVLWVVFVCAVACMYMSVRACESAPGKKRGVGTPRLYEYCTAPPAVSMSILSEIWQR